jgi:hypothetical protein
MEDEEGRVIEGEAYHRCRTAEDVKAETLWLEERRRASYTRRAPEIALQMQMDYLEQNNERLNDEALERWHAKGIGRWQTCTRCLERSLVRAV